MNQTDPNIAPRRRLHPLIATAAAAVIVASLGATAAITGVLPTAFSSSSQNDQTQTGQTTEMAPPSVIDSTQPTIDSTQPAPSVHSVQMAPNKAPTNPRAQQQAAGTGAPPPQYGQQPQQYAQQGQYDQAGQAGQESPQAGAACAACGTVVSISAVKHEGHGTGIGAVGGAVAGGLVGNQFGAGGGRVAMTLLGALGGGVGGNALEKHLRSTTDYSVRVRMEDGKTRHFTYHQAPPFQQGQRVRVENGALVAA
ncbi:glycine zipper 2TM domain-containing protein [Paraburkholderia adhaesiva]|uniref:glycine zipper 2TM domain-containing protein n=1 Tax=Paraburkholderia adhaesiva TaxID=2883244 RepID=UPI001F15C4F7|nr:glycine zipper 2TM domain-containing protein [Paraburkholderia adhaesiva]